MIHKHRSTIHKHRSNWPKHQPTATSSQKCSLCLCWCVRVWVYLILVDFVVCSCCGGGGRRCWVAMVGLFVVVGLCVVGSAELRWSVCLLVCVSLAVLSYQLQRLWVEERVRGRERMWRVRKKIKIIYRKLQ